MAGRSIEELLRMVNQPRPAITPSDLAEETGGDLDDIDHLMFKDQRYNLAQQMNNDDMMERIAESVIRDYPNYVADLLAGDEYADRENEFVFGNPKMQGAEDSPNGYWDAAHMGNGMGKSGIMRDGVRQAADPVGNGPGDPYGSTDAIRAAVLGALNGKTPKQVKAVGADSPELAEDIADEVIRKLTQDEMRD